MLVSPGGERHGRRQVRPRRARLASFGAVFGRSRTDAAAAANDHTQVDLRRTCRMGLPATRAEPNSPARAEPRTVAAAPAPGRQNSPRAAMPNVLAPAPLSSMRWNDAPTTRSLANPADLQVAAANPPAARRRRSRKCSSPRQSGCARRSGSGDGKADRIAAEAASGDGRRPRAGRPHGKRDRQDRPHAGTPRHAPQAARDVGFRKDKAAFAAADVPRRGRRAAAYRRCIQSARAPGKDTRAPGKDNTRAPSGACRRRRPTRPRSGHARPRNGDTCPTRIGSGSCRLRKCWPGSPAARRPNRNGSGGYFPAGAAACERTR